MIPLGDETRRTEHFPIITVALISMNVLAFLLELSNGDAFVSRWSVVPHEVTAGRHLRRC